MITLDERVKYRNAIKQLHTLKERLDGHLTGRKPMDDATIAALVRMTDTSEPANQLKAVQNTLDDVDSQYDEQLRYAAQFKYSPFCEYMFRDEPPALHQEFLIDHMEAVHHGDILRLAISMPPGAAKSTYASHRFPAWHLGRRPSDRWVQGAHTQTFAKDRLGKVVRSIISEDRYRNVFPEMVLSSASSAAEYFEFVGARGYYKAVGVGTGIAGYRFEVGAIDDPIASREDAESPTFRRKLHDWFDDDFGTRPSNPLAPIFVVNTRWHEDDLVGHELQKMAEGRGDKWTVLNVPAIAQDNDPIGREPGEGLWPELFGTEYYLARKRSITGRSWNSLYQGEPADEEGGTLKRDDVQRYKHLPKDEVDDAGNITKAVIKRVTLSIDAAEKATERSDYTAATVWAETMEKKHYLVHASRIKKEFTEIVLWIEEMARMKYCGHKVSQILVEDRGAGTQYIQVRQTSPGAAPVIPINTKQQSKAFRFDGVTPMFPTGQVLLPESGNDWIADVEAELFAFPAGRNDDFVDTVSQYLTYVRENNFQRGVRKLNANHG